MATNDIYDSKSRYDRFVANYKNILTDKSVKNRKYFCTYKKNLEYFEDLFKKFDSKDLSYIRRTRVLMTFKIIVHACDKDLKVCNQTDVDKIVAFMHKRYKSPKSKSDFIRDIKTIWRWLFPETDSKGRPDSNITPYAVRHLSAKIDKSKERKQKDKLGFDEYTKIVNYFSDNKCIRAFLTLMVESLARPQELLYLRIKDVKISDEYAIPYVAEHGKEGTKPLHCFDSFPYVLAWYKEHPLKKDKEAFFFLNQYNEQLKNDAINKQLKLACKKLGIDKRITCYSFKRNGVTFDLLSGKNPQTIQKKANWSSMDQLETYSKMTVEDNMILEGIRKGKIKDQKVIVKYKPFLKGLDYTKTKECIFCEKQLGFEEEVCPNCKRIVDRSKVKQQIENTDKLEKTIDEMKQKQEHFETMFFKALAQIKPDIAVTMLDDEKATKIKQILN